MPLKLCGVHGLQVNAMRARCALVIRGLFIITWACMCAWCSQMTSLSMRALKVDTQYDSWSGCRIWWEWWTM